MATTTSSTRDAILSLEDVLNTEVLESSAQIHGAMVALVGRAHMFSLGGPGIAKSMLFDRVLLYISGLRAFSHLMSPFTTPEETWGPRDVPAMKRSESRRNTAGYLPEADAAFLDEIWEGASAFLNTLLKIVNEGVYKDGPETKSAPLSSLFCASNHLPGGEGRLTALADRIDLWYEVQAIRDPGNFRAMLCAEVEEHPKALLTWDEVLVAQKEVAAVRISDEVKDAYVLLRRQLADAGIHPTPRRFKRSLHKLVKAEAWLDGSDVTATSHMEILTNAMWTNPDQQADVSRVVLGISNPLEIDALKLLEKIEGLVTAVDEAIADPDNSTALCMELRTKLKKARVEIDDLEAKTISGRRRRETLARCRSRLEVPTYRILKDVLGMEEAEISGLANL